MKKRTRAAIVVMVSTLILVSCAVDKEGLSRDTKKLADIVTGNDPEEVVLEVEETTDALITEASVVETEETALPEETTPSPTPIPTATATPTPSPTPEAEPTLRVDFSELIDNEIIEGFTVEEEDFREHYGLDEEEFVVFEGKRLLISMNDNDVPANSVNLILNGFYKEAEGIYGRYCDEAQAEFDLTKEVLYQGEVKVNYEYKVNDRLIAVRMNYETSMGEEVNTKNELEMFDMYTGARVTLYDLTGDPDALIELMLQEFDEEVPKEYDVIMLAPDSSEELMIWMVTDGNFYREHIAIEEVAPYLNRYGLSVFGG